MKMFTAIPRSVVYSLLAVFVVIIGATSYLVGSNAVKDKHSDEAHKACPYTQHDLDEIFDKFDQPEPQLSPEELRLQDWSEPQIDSDAIKALEGQCLDVALETAYELGIRSYRDLTDCSPKCILTMEYSYNRINFVVEDRRMTEVYVG